MMPTGPTVSDRIDGGLGIAQHRRPVGIGDEFARHRDLVGRIAEVKLGSMRSKIAGAMAT